jgi:hypothetical protein
MLTPGGDAHKRVHGAVALDAVGRERGRRRAPNAAAGWQELLAWAAGLEGPEAPRRWGAAGAWGSGRGLARPLVEAGEAVSGVSPRRTAEARPRARRPGTGDALGAPAGARLVLGDAATLPAVGAAAEPAGLALLTTERAAAGAAGTRRRSRRRALLLQLDPEHRAHLPALATKAGPAAREGHTAPRPRRLDQARAAAVRRLAQRLRPAADQAAALAQQIGAQVQTSCVARTRRRGVNLKLLPAGARAGLLGPGPRFRTEAHPAADAGGAPLEASSAGRVRQRLNRGGHRRPNALLYRIALTQARSSPPAQAYLARRTAAGKRPREALRALKRHPARAVWRRWQEGLATREAPAAPAPAAAGAGAAGRGPRPERLATLPGPRSNASRAHPLTHRSIRTTPDARMQP